MSDNTTDTKDSNINTPDTYTVDTTSTAQSTLNNIYTRLVNANKSELFLYLVFFFVAMWMARKFSWNIYLTFIITIFIIFILINRSEYIEFEENKQLASKLQDIYPPPQTFNKYPEIIEFFYSIKDLAVYNQIAYDQVIYNTDALITIYQDALIGLDNCKANHDIARERYHDALNSMHSLIFTILPNKYTQLKLRNALRKFQSILDYFLSRIKSICDEEIQQKGFNVDRSPVDIGPLAGNFYEKNKYYFDYY